MNRTLKDLRTKSINLYHSYRTGIYSLEEYLEQIKPIDIAIDELELKALIDHFEDTFASKISFLKHLD